MFMVIELLQTYIRNFCRGTVRCAIVFMLILEEWPVEGMILNLLRILSFSFIKAGYLDKVIWYIHCGISVVLAIYFCSKHQPFTIPRTHLLRFSNFVPLLVLNNCFLFYEILRYS